MTDNKVNKSDKSQTKKTLSKGGNNKKKGTGKKKFNVKILLACVAAVVLLVIGIAVAYTIHLYSLMNIDTGETTTLPSEENIYETVENPEDIAHLPTITIDDYNKTEEEKKEARHVDGVYNILLLGLDTTEGKKLTDTLMIATLDTRSGEIKLTSVMRDILVPIPGYSPNKLNVPYKLGGIALLYQVFEESFEIKIDGYVAINYEALETVVDVLGGVPLYIKQEEADFLNTSNYISDEKSRNLLPNQTQTVNGSQFVGYCRQRWTTADADFGRTKRQRYALNAVYEKFRNSGIDKILATMEAVLPYVITDIKFNDMVSLATNAVKTGLGDIQQLRIPTNTTHVEAQYKGMSVIDMDFAANTKILHEFIFGDYIE
ncbi:MAG: LCP family protein [Lachnospiraceae bacterium]|nr:LCP family protein [Lachnospiraceae bacterium]